VDARRRCALSARSAARQEADYRPAASLRRAGNLSPCGRQSARRRGDIR
jgi:hypothetical protein